MLPGNAIVAVRDVLNYHQNHGRFSVPKRGFSAISLRLNTNGKYIAGNKILHFKPPSICIIPAGVPYERISLEDDIFVIHFDFLNCVMEDIEVYKISDAEKYQRLFARALQIRSENPSGAQYKENAVLYEILGEISDDISLQNTKKNYISESAEYMKHSFSDSGLSIDGLAKRANVSPAQYRRKFRQLYGESPKQYLDSLRFNYAKSLLETGYFSHKEIAFRCGFSDVVYFRTAFKTKTGKSLKEYLKELSE